MCELEYLTASEVFASTCNICEKDAVLQTSVGNSGYMLVLRFRNVVLLATCSNFISLRQFLPHATDDCPHPNIAA